MMQSNEIIAAISTPPGVGAIAIVRVSGNGCIDLVNTIFKGKKFIRTTITHTSFWKYYGWGKEN